MKTNKDRDWVEDISAIASFTIPFLLILMAVFVPERIAGRDMKDDLFTAGITALVTGGIKSLGKKVEVRQDVQTQEMNLSPSADFVQYNPGTRSNPYLSQVNPEDIPYLEDRSHVASAPYKVVNPDE